MVTGRLKKFEIIDHPSDIGISLKAESLEEVFEYSAWGMFSIMCDIEKVKPAVKRIIRINEKGKIRQEDLLVSWLEKLLYIYEVKKMLFCRFNINRLETESRKAVLDAEIFGEKIDVSKHELLVSIKAPTYHMLQLFKDSSTGDWNCQVIFDV